MNKIKEIELDNERIFLKKGFLGWNVVYPYKIDGKIVWKNLIAGGNWWRLLIIGFIVLIILGSVWEYSNAVRVANQCLNQSSILNSLIN